jgi:hypothetical protein
MLAHGFGITLLADLVRDRLVTAELNTTRVVWIQITDRYVVLAGQIALAAGIAAIITMILK